MGTNHAANFNIQHPTSLHLTLKKKEEYIDISADA
jgi:hypothetical protein